METHLLRRRGLRIAVEGCGHGTLNAIYASIKRSCEINGWDGVDLVIIGGDFQAVRNAKDLNCMACPVKYRHIGDFHEYYSGIRTAPYLTIFIGGNHEASSHIWELYYGGWAAPNIYYLGAANVVRIGPLRIAGLSGIWKGYNYRKPHYERLPYSSDDERSIYHVRELDVRKLLQIRTQVDIGLSHDWPNGIEMNGDYDTLFRKKKHFLADSKAGTLGSKAAKYVLDRLKPAYWLSAHMHVKYSAIVEHDKSPQHDFVRGNPGLASKTERDTKNKEEINLDLDWVEVKISEAQETSGKIHNDAEITLDMGDIDAAASPHNADYNDNPSSQEVPNSLREQLPASFNQPEPQPSRSGSHLPPPPQITNTLTRFLALDKCLPGREFLQILEIEPISASPEEAPGGENRLRLEYDKEWLAITRVFASELVLGSPGASVPPNRGEAAYLSDIEREEKWVEEYLVRPSKMVIPENFAITAPIQEPTSLTRTPDAPEEYNNPQTQAFCDLVGIENKFFASEEDRRQRMERGQAVVGQGEFGRERRGRWEGRGGGGRGRGRGKRARGGRGGWL